MTKYQNFVVKKWFQIFSSFSKNRVILVKVNNLYGEGMRIANYTHSVLNIGWVNIYLSSGIVCVT